MGLATVNIKKGGKIEPIRRVVELANK